MMTRKRRADVTAAITYRYSVATTSERNQKHAASDDRLLSHINSCTAGLLIAARTSMSLLIYNIKTDSGPDNQHNLQHSL